MTAFSISTSLSLGRALILFPDARRLYYEGVANDKHLRLGLGGLAVDSRRMQRSHSRYCSAVVSMRALGRYFRYYSLMIVDCD